MNRFIKIFIFLYFKAYNNSYYISHSVLTVRIFAELHCKTDIADTLAASQKLVK